MSNKRVYISGLYGLKSPNKFDYARTISEGTHTNIHFVIYNDENDTSQGWIAYDVVISDRELFELLRERAEVKVEEPVHRY